MAWQREAVIRLHPADNVVIALEDLPTGSTIDGLSTATLSAVPRGHKLATRDIPQGATILRYGQIIGEATRSIRAGEHVHSSNLGMGEHQQDSAFGSDMVQLPSVAKQATFEGYHRADGRVGTRNYLGILTTVNCAGSVAQFIAEAVNRAGLLDRYDNIDGIVPISHSTGCGMSGENEGYETLHRTLMGYAKNPNFGGVLLVGLGCEVMQIDDLVGGSAMRTDGNVRYMGIQRTGGTRKTVERGVEEIKALAETANTVGRSTAPASKLVLGMQCGGSDGYSGITANPALGVASDLLVRHGGISILSETPEIYGAEHLLTRRAVSAAIGEKLMERIRWWEDYTARNGGEMDNNPSPGNKRGGLTTILEKSLGAVAKGGSAPLAGVYKFAEQIDTPGFAFMDSPGYDPCSVTGQIASGANLITFTTGRGSVSGYKPVPCVKLSTNSQMYRHMEEDMDINCGDIIENGVAIEEKGREIFEHLLAVASGRETKSEALGFGGVEFVPWQIGAVM